MNDQVTEMKAILVRAADTEARRQAARARGDEQTMRLHEFELRRLWQRYMTLDRSTHQPKEAIR